MDLDFMKKAQSHKETIICPSCGSIEEATIIHTLPWWMYAHICSKCEYQILESEWNRCNMENEIVFDNNYPKLHKQKHACLVMAIQDISGEELLKRYPIFTAYDTKRDDGRYYDIKLEENYMLLLFVGDKNIMFSSLRKQTKENAKLYAESVGEMYKIKIMPKEADYGCKQGSEGRNY